MLDHTKPYSIMKKYIIDAELAGHVHKLDVKLQRLCGSGFSLFAVRILAKFCHFGVNWPITLCDNKDGVHFFPLKLECHNSYCITIYYCVILQMVILHNAIKQFRMFFLCFFEKRTKTCFFSISPQKMDCKKQEGWIFLKLCFSTLTIFQNFFVIFPWSHDLEQVTSLSVWLGVRCTPRVKDPGNEEAENCWHLIT